jgi:hypothetical protein
MSGDCGGLMAARRAVRGETSDRIGFSLRYARWLERIEHSLRDEAYRIAAGHAHDLTSFDEHVANFEAVLGRYREACAAILDLRRAQESTSKVAAAASLK